jgi:NHL repeat
MRHRAIAHTTAATVLLAGLLVLLALAPAAFADKAISETGGGAGQTKNPRGLAVDFETGRLYVADQGNNRVDVFESSGAFVMAFGWGVDTKANEFQTCTTASTCNAGIAGSGAGQFSAPAAIAVDNDPLSPSFHDVYVFDQGIGRIAKFNPKGELLDEFGSAGEGDCQFSGTAVPNIAVGPGGIVHVAESTSTPEEDVFSSRVEKFEPSGACLAPVPLGVENEAKAIAVDSSGDVYIPFRVLGGIRKFHPDGTEYTAPPYPLDITVGAKFGFETHTIAIDASDNLFAAQREDNVQVITEYSPAGAHLKRFGYGEIPQSVAIPGLAPYSSAEGDVFASEGDAGVRYLAFPPPGPVVFPEPCKANPPGNTKATLFAEVNPEGKATTVHFQYVDEESFKEEGGFASPNTKETAESAPIGSDTVLHGAGVQAEVEPETKYHCRVIATSSDGSVTGEEGTFTSLEPLEIGDTWASDVGSEAATLNATVNPLGIPATGYFEYVDEATYQASGFAEAKQTSQIDFGAGESFTVGKAEIADLAPGTSYRYRIVATDIRIEPKWIPGPTHALRTYRLGSEGLPDGRRYELVSPGKKNSAEVAVPGAAGGLFPEDYLRIQAGAASGEAVSYTSWTSFGDAEGAHGSSQYLSRRTASGWETENLTPFGFESNPLKPPYHGFSNDLGLAALVVSLPALTADCQEGFENLYLRDNETGVLQCLTIEEPKIDEDVVVPCLAFAGASDDGSRAFFAADASYAGAPEGPGFSLYEWSAAEGLKPVSVLPGQSAPVAPTSNTAFGIAGPVHCETGQKLARHVISADGRRAFWTYVPKSGETRLMVRIDGEETVQLDKKVSGAGSSGGGVFLGASADGSKAFFTDRNKLMSGAGEGDRAGEGDLYLYELPGEELKDLTPDSLTAGPEAADVQGVAGISDDGSHVYFVAKGVLSEEENSASQKAKAGKHNLYLYHEGETSFIATLDPAEDFGAWESQPRALKARVTPDGRHLAFLSIEAETLADYDNRLIAGEHCRPTASEGQLVGSPRCPQAFLYDAETRELTCASCNPSGARPLGPTRLPSWTNPYEGPRYLADNGSRLFFESDDELLPGDENGNRDVYEFERPGEGTCGTGDPHFDPASGGCHFLLSSGKSEDETYLLDASMNGRDVFFSARHRLVGWDQNDNFDVYDAREGGGFPEPPAPLPICDGETCKPPSATPPSGSSPATAIFQGPGNASQGRPRCPKGKVRRKARCVKRGRHDRPRGHKSKANGDRRAGR